MGRWLDIPLFGSYPSPHKHYNTNSFVEYELIRDYEDENISDEDN